MRSLLFWSFGFQSVEKMAGFCNDLRDSGLHSTPLQFTLQCALEAKKTGECTTYVVPVFFFDTTDKMLLE